MTTPPFLRNTKRKISESTSSLRWSVQSTTHLCESLDQKRYRVIFLDPTKTSHHRKSQTITFENIRKYVNRRGQLNSIDEDFDRSFQDWFMEETILSWFTEEYLHTHRQRILLTPFDPPQPIIYN